MKKGIVMAINADEKKYPKKKNDIQGDAFMAITQFNFKLAIFLVILISLCFNLNPSHAKDLLFPASHFPPYIITENKDHESGIDIDILKEMAKRLDLNLKIINCPWKRCLYLIKHGKGDILSTVYKMPEREVFMTFIEPPYMKDTVISFYFQKGREHTVKKFDDLQGLTIGVLNEYKYDSKFDNDLKIKKHSVFQEIILLKMLKAGRLDAFIGDDVNFDYLIYTNGFKGFFKKAPYNITTKYGSYFAVSKKSVFAEHVPLFSKTLKQMKKEGITDKIINSYLGRE